jgi:hypothetical protein
MERHVCQFQTVSTEGFTPNRCAQFCAYPTSKTIALSGSRGGMQVACTGAENEHNSKPSQSISILFGRSLNQRVGGSSPPRFTKLPINTRVSEAVPPQCA